jgi:serine/threonine protein phosphatase PrpC
MSSIRGLQLESAQFSLQGGRDYNEDGVAECEAYGAVRLFMLADGAGGQGGGGVASRIALTAMQSEFMALPVFAPETLQRCMDKADEAVRAQQGSAAELARMASTFVAFLVNYHRRQALMCNLGDSRCYVFRGAEVIAQSYDHSLVQRFVDAGLYPKAKLREHPRRNVLYASLGANEEKVPPYVSAEPIDLQPGDGIMLCSDGVWEVLEDAVLGELHAVSHTVDHWREQLIAAVEAHMPPGHDNFSALLVRCLPDRADNGEEDSLVTLQPGR